MNPKIHPLYGFRNFYELIVSKAGSIVKIAKIVDFEQKMPPIQNLKFFEIQPINMDSILEFSSFRFILEQ